MPISIGIPIYNAEKFLPDAIRSVFAQTYQDWELILVDDGSTDRSLEIARSVDDPRVRVLSDGINRHIAYRLNQITDEAKYDIIARMDADDMMFPDRLKTQLALFDDPMIQIVGTAICTISDNNEIQTIRNNRGVQDVTPRGVIRYRYRLSHPTMMVRKKWYLQNRYDESLRVAEDLDLFLRSSFQGTLTNSVVRVINEPLLFYREDHSQNFQKTRMWNQDIHYVLNRYLSSFGRFERLAFQTLWKMRGTVYLIAALFGIVPKIKRFRERNISDSAVLRYLNTELQTIFQTKVPGLDR